MKSLISFIALIGLASCLTFGSYDSNLDPGRIVWPKDTWFNNPIELAQTNTGSTVTMTVNFRPTTTLTGATVQIIFPSTYSTESTKTVTLSTTYNLESGKDTSVTYSTTLPSAGSYGPFGIVTRRSETGQIVDANYNFGCIAVTSSVSSSSLTVSRTTSSTATTINTDNTLEFQFTLTFSLWAHDIIEIAPDSNWVLKTGPTCKSVGDSNPLLGPDSSNTSNLPCSLGLKSSTTAGVATGADTTVASDSIYIYGIASDAYVSQGSTSNSYTIKLDVSSITSPAWVTSSSSWTVYIWRFGTNNLLAKYYTSSGPASTAGSATFTSWQSVNFPSNTVMQNQVIFTKLTVGTNNPLPAESTLTVTFSGVNIYDTIWWSDLDTTTGASADGLCYVTPAIDGASCSASDATTATVTFTKAQAKGSVSFVLLSYLSGSSPTVTKITTYYGSTSNVVDQSASNPGTFTVKVASTTYYKIPDVALHALSHGTTSYPKMTSQSAPAPYALGASGSVNGQNQGGVKNKDIFIRITPGSSNTWGGGSGYATTVVLYFNRATSFEYSNFGSVYFESTASKADYIDTASSFSSAAATLTATTNGITPGVSTSNQLSLSFTSSTDGLASGSYYFLQYSDATKTSLPFIASNLGTFYEIWAIASYTVTTTATTEIGSSVISVLPQTASSQFFTVPICIDNLDGIPIVNHYEPLTVDFDFSSQSYAIDIEIDVGYSTTTGFMGTGIMANSDNTGTLTLNTNFLSSASGATATFKVSTNKLTITLKGLGSTTISSSTKVLTYFPSAIATLAEASLNINSYFYFPKSSDSSVRQVLYQGSLSWTVASVKNFDATSTGATKTSATAWAIGSSAGVTISNTLDSDNRATSIVNNDYIGIGLSPGFIFSGTPTYSVKVGSGSTTNSPASTTYYLGSSSDTGVGGFIMAYGTWGAATPTSTASTYDLAVTALQPPNHSLIAGEGTWGVWVASSSAIGGACSYSEAYSSSSDSTVTIDETTLATPTCTSSSGSIIGLSADSVNLSMTFGFTTTITVPKDGKVTFTLDSSWTWPSTASSYSSSISATFGISGSTLTATLTAELKAGSYTVIAAGVAPPTNSGASSIDKDCFTALKTSTAGFTIESWATAGGSPLQTSIASSASVTTGVSTLTVNAYPNVPSKLADILLTFSLNKKIPATGYITISTPSSLTWSYSTSTASIKNYCWTNFVYSRCEIASSTTINIYPSADIASGTSIVVYLDGATTFSAAGSSGNFLIYAYWGSAPTKIVDDSAVTSGGAAITVGSAVSAALTLGVTMDISTAGEKAAYTFTFSSEAAIASGDLIYIQFPRDFDAYIGDADNTYPDCLPNNWYLTCTSSALGTGITCTADHWYLIVSGASAQSAGASASLVVYGVRNPGPSATGYFNIWHYDSTQKLKASFYSSVSVTPTSSISNINLKPLSATDRTLTTSTTYNFDFYPAISSSTTFSSANTFNIVFPQQFNVKLYSTSSLSCSASTYDETSATSPTGSSWVSTSSCSVSGNVVSFAIPSGSTPTVKTTDRIRISLTSVNNPQYGLTRTKGWDVTGSNYGSSYSYWSNRFDLYVVDSTNKVLTGRTYGVLNSGYLGYSLSTASSIDVNSYKGSTKANHIQLLPGQQSGDISISVVSGSNNFGLKSQKLVLTAKTNSNYPDTASNIKFTSFYHSYTAFQLDSEIAFRVSAATGTALGIYYIDWTVVETRQDGVANNIYSAPLSVMVEVCSTPTTGTIVPTVDTLPTLYVGYTSIPIFVTLPSAPATQLIVTPSFGTTATGITINPATLTFTPDTETLYFELVVASTYATTQTPKLSFTVTGTDAAIYAAPASQSPTVTATLPTSSTSLTLSAGTPTGTSMTITAKFSQDAVIYWGLTCYGAAALTYSELKAQIQSLVSPESTIDSLEKQLADEYLATETHIDYTKDTDITSFFKRIHKNHCNTLWSSAIVNRSKNGQVQITFDWLMDNTHYSFYAYADNKISSTQPTATTDFTTSSSQAVYSTSVTFTGDVAASLDDSIRRGLAKNMGVNPDWLISTGRTTPSSATGSLRFLQTSTTTYSRFNYQMVYDRSKPGYSPSYMLAQLDQTGATTDLTSIAGSAPAAFGSATSVSTGTVPTWSVDPSKTSVADTSAVFSVTSSQVGIACVSCTDITTTKTTYAWQVIDGLDAESNEAHGTCANVTTAATAISLTVSGLTQATSYTCYFTACNSYPTHTYCMDASTSGSTVTPLKSVSITTTGSKDDAAIYLGLLTAFFLIFN
ncbi:unnamed protein product [Blepharisma stoltei]|uniref:Uncharacterized protein n=1 Tax=Blepharisma stoltei TaxID=1481888 RepID=A0AAU9JX55_9CILI|nr:unnamed protein product [Blepharisma stoltei]